MRAASDAHTSVIPATQARSALVRLAIALFATLLLLAVWRPSMVHAQANPTPAAKPKSSGTESATSTHVVKAGESLWSLAERYYGSGYQWQELARQNALQTERSKVLLVGMKLRVPSAVPANVPSVSTKTAVPAIARTPAVAASSAAKATAASTDPASGGASTSLAAQTADKSDAPPAAAATPRSKSVASSAKSAPKLASAASTSAAAAAKSAPAPAASVQPAAAAPAVAVAAATGETASAERSVALANAGRMSPQMRAETLLTRQTTRIGLVDRADLSAARGNDASTVFLRRVPEAEEVSAQARAASRGDAPMPRRGEYEAAPFSLDLAAIAKGGRVLRRVGAPTGGSPSELQHVMLLDEIEIAPPAGSTLAVGDRLVTVHLTAEVSKGVRVAVPTGVVRITRVVAGKPILAVVQSQSGGMMQGQALLPIQGSAAPLSARATDVVSDDIATSVRWIDASESLPTLQSFVLLGAGSAQGVQAGDEFELRTAPRAGGVAAGERIARARVVRVDGKESAAIIVKQDRADIAIGVAARRVARVP